MSIKTPNQLVSEFKKSGEFECLRRDLLSQFQSSGSLEPLLQRVEDIAQKRLDTDEKLHSKAPEVVQKELLQELDRYPMVERAVGETSILSDPALASGIQQHARKILKRSRGEAVTDDQPEDVGAPHPDPSMDLQPALVDGAQTAANSAPEPTRASSAQPIATDGLAPEPEEQRHVNSANGNAGGLSSQPAPAEEKMDTSDD